MQWSQRIRLTALKIKTAFPKLKTTAKSVQTSAVVCTDFAEVSSLGNANFVFSSVSLIFLRPLHNTALAALFSTFKPRHLQE